MDCSGESAKDLKYFRSIPWCAALIDDEKYAITSTNFRVPKESTENLLFRETLKSDRTISACLSFYKKPAAVDQPIEEVHSLLLLNAGVNGHAHVCHGGVVATVVDEIMSLHLILNKDREAEVARKEGRVPLRVPTVTAELNVTYIKPVVTPQTIWVTARISKIDGRKIWLNATVKDGSGTILATAGSLFLRARREKL
jgi:acyl-coenzyme A thioesterase PaaI-like protein